MDAVLAVTINKGSIAVDGISLTINACEKDFFEVNIIPQTGMVTPLLTKKKIGDTVNIETDLTGKYVEKLFSNINNIWASSHRTFNFQLNSTTTNKDNY